jgi:hypothetical protein
MIVRNALSIALDHGRPNHLEATFLFDRHPNPAQLMDARVGRVRINLTLFA